MAKNKIPEIKRIAIKFGDNDFHCTFKGVLKILLDSIREDKLVVNKAHLTQIINELSFGVYLSHQNQFQYQASTPELEHIRKYLKIKKENVLINEEVTEYLKENNWDNCETFILDAFIDYPGNSPIFSR